MSDRDPAFSTKFLIFGIVFIMLGGVLLLRTTGYLPAPGRLWPLIVLIAGIAMLYFVHARQASEGYILFGMLFTLSGSFLLIVNTFFTQMSLRQFWPILMGIIGVSLIPFGSKKSGSARLALIVPGIAMFALSLLFFPFSLGIARVRFRVFVLTWWPVLFVVLGAILLIAYFRRRGRDGGEEG